MSASRSLLRALTLALLAATGTACSSVPDWVDPTTWGSSANEPSTAPSDSSGAAAANESSSQGTTVAEASDKYPVLADTPSKAPTTSSMDEQKQVANGLVADRAQAQYSAEALQAGSEPAAAPPPAASAETTLASSASPLPTDQPAASSATAPATPVQDRGVTAMPGTLPAEAGGPNAQAASTPAATAVGQSPLASAPLAVPAPAAAAQNDAAFGFQPSHAPALDPAVAQIAGTAMIQHDQRFASLAPAAPAMTFSSTPAAVVSFPAQTLALDEKGIAQVQAAVTAFKAKGGYVRVVGHSASGAPGLSPDRQLMQSFDRSQACATAVARELIRQGVPASHVLVDAESTLAADEQRRAEIFLQS